MGEETHGRGCTLSISYSRSRISMVCSSVKPFSPMARHVRCTCSMHGEKLHRTPLGRSERAADGTTFHGPGRSKNTPSAMPARSSGKPCVVSCSSHQLISISHTQKLLKSQGTMIFAAYNVPPTTLDGLRSQWLGDSFPPRRVARTRE